VARTDDDRVVLIAAHSLSLSRRRFRYDEVSNQEIEPRRTRRIRKKEILYWRAICKEPFALSVAPKARSRRAVGDASTSLASRATLSANGC
jgi:hypothetical protein